MGSLGSLLGFCADATKGYAAPETKAAVEQARVGETLRDKFACTGSHRVVGQSRTAVAGALGVSRGRRATHAPSIRSRPCPARGGPDLAWPWLHSSLNAIGWRFFQLVA